MPLATMLTSVPLLAGGSHLRESEGNMDTLLPQADLVGYRLNFLNAGHFLGDKSCQSALWWDGLLNLGDGYVSGKSIPELFTVTGQITLAHTVSWTAANSSSTCYLCPHCRLHYFTG